MRKSTYRKQVKKSGSKAKVAEAATVAVKLCRVIVALLGDGVVVLMVGGEERRSIL